MSIIRDYEAEKEFDLMRWLSEAIDRMDKLQLRAATAVTSTPQDERTQTGSETAVAGRPFEDVQ